MPVRTEFKDIRYFFTAIAKHRCARRAISTKDEQGTSIESTFMGFICGCGDYFVINPACIVALDRRIRQYITSRQGRMTSATRLTTEPMQFLAELLNGTDQ